MSKKIGQIILIVLLLGIVGVSKLNATIYYVNDNSTTSDTWCSAVGNDANDGLSASTPKLTLADVLADYANAAGDIIRIDKGTYTWSQVSMDASGSAGNVITIIGAGQSNTVITGSGGGYGVTTADYDYITFQNLQWINSLNYVFFMSAGSTNITASYCTFNCTAANNGYRAVGFYNGCSSCTVDQCIVSAERNPVLFYNSSSNTLSNCNISSVSGTLGLIRLEQTSQNNTISDNILNGVAGIQYIIYCETTSTGTTISGNRIDGNTCQTGIYMVGTATNFTIKNNYFYDIKDGINSTATTCTGTNCYFNSMYCTVNCLKGYFGTWNIKNNILYTTSNSNGDYCFNNCCAAYYPTTLDYNLYYHPNDARAAWFDGADYAAKADIVTGTAFEDNGLEADPGYPLATVWYLDIDATDPQYLTGVAIGGITTDIKRNTRPSPPSIGATEVGSPLPVQLISFTGEKTKKSNRLFWGTAMEINSEYFEVLRSSDGINFESIAKMKAAGNSNHLLNYVFVDHEPLNGMNYYQLKQFDYDGANETFDIVAINNSESGFKMNAIFPNPIANLMTVNFQAEESGAHFIFIDDVQGNEVYSAMIAALKGENNFQLFTTQYSSGNYFLRIVNHKQETIFSQIVVQH
ncbi:MAG: right-handed parallel beta-helix repeat-containing protein [Bacteroidetes bacterium]|nr:right-handed parallel beta-helix repeat-containing protein [Bacteroidota bacterium]